MPHESSSNPPDGPTLGLYWQRSYSRGVINYMFLDAPEYVQKTGSSCCSISATYPLCWFCPTSQRGGPGFDPTSTGVGACENKVTFSERSYAHCSMYRYVHPRTHICACASHFMEGSVRLSLSKHYTPQLGASVPSSEAFAVPGPSTPQLGAVVPSPATPKLPVTVNLAYLGSFCLGCRMVILLETRART